MADSPSSVRDRVVEYLNSAAFLPSEKEKIETLCKVQELVIHCDQTLLDAFFEDIVVFQNDKNVDVRKFVVGFIEEACKNDHGMLPRLVPNVCLLLQDKAMAVVKRVVQATGQILKSTLMWLSSSRNTTKAMEQTWDIVLSMKNKILNMIDHENDGVRTQAIKFLETLILCQTYTEKDSMERNGDLSLDQVPLTLKVTKPRKLEEEAKQVLTKVIEFQGSLHISSVNLMTCMSSLSIIARARPQYMGIIIEAMEILHANLPPTLTKSQVNSVRKHLKIQLLNILRHVGAYDYHENIIAILNDLNVSSSEINKAMPNKEELRSRVKRSKVQGDKSSSELPAKKPRMEKPEAAESKAAPVLVSEKKENESAIDITQNWIANRLGIEAVTNLVMVSMLNLPDSIPSLFSASYKPVTAAGSSNQVLHLSRLIASQLTAAGLGPGAEVAEKRKEKERVADFNEDEDNTNKLIPRLLSQTVETIESQKEEEYEAPLMPAAMVSRPTFQKAKFVKLSEVTKPLARKQSSNLQLILLKNVLKTGDTGIDGVAYKNKRKIIAKLSAFSSYEELVELESFVFEDLRANVDFLLSWIFALYSSTHNFNLFPNIISGDKETDSMKEFHTYDSFTKHILTKLSMNTPTKERDEIISRVVMNCPSISEELLAILWGPLNQGEDSIKSTVTLLKDLCFFRPIVSEFAINTLCLFMTHADYEVRNNVEPTILDLLTKEKFRVLIIETAQTHLGYLVESNAPEELFKDDLGRPDYIEDWNEDSVKACLYLTLTVLPVAQDLIHFLAQVYVKTVNEAKRTILRYLEIPVSHMGMDSPTLLSLVDTCPKGSETLVTRVIHILTEKAPPSEDLVTRVKDLYNKRVSDVRFLIPVLTGLSKKEVIAVLPKLIKLNPQVVKEVFNRLWGVTLDKGTSPLSPVDLLVALHLLNTDKCDMKTIIKATSLCFAERNIYNAEVLAAVLQQLLEEPSLPTLFMRTVLQTLTHHPKLLAFIMNILQRLIGKQIWKQTKAWEGFVKCCQRAMPQSFLVLLQLPHTQLAKALTEAPDMHAKLLSHVHELTDEQKAHIPSSLLEVIEDPSSKLHNEKSQSSREK